MIWVFSLLLSSCVSKPSATPEIPVVETEILEPSEIETEPEAKEEVEMPEATKVSSSSGVLQSEVKRDLDPQTTETEMEKLAASNNAFALDFYQQARSELGNLFFSPYSLSIALAMTYAGARGETAEQMAQVLHFDLPQAALHQAFNTLDLDLSSRSGGEAGEDEAQPFQLSVANALWGQAGYPFSDEFLVILALNYGAGLRLLDFAQAAEQARQEINEWVEVQTRGKIKNLIPEGIPLEMTRLVLTNAIYFKADWQFPFKKEATSEQPFNLLDGNQAQVEMMAQSDPIPLQYLMGDGFQALEFPYVGDEAAMLLLVPDADNFADFEARLDADLVDEIIGQMKEERVSLYMPKFSFTKEITANEVYRQWV